MFERWSPLLARRVKLALRDRKSFCILNAEGEIEYWWWQATRWCRNWPGKRFDGYSEEEARTAIEHAVAIDSDSFGFTLDPLSNETRETCDHESGWFVIRAISGENVMIRDEIDAAKELHWCRACGAIQVDQDRWILPDGGD